MDNNRGKLIWIDDDIDHFKPHIMFLEEKGYEVTLATNGSDGIELIANTGFSIVLLDQFMPGMDGMQTLRRIKEVKPAIPVIMITKSEEEWLMDEAISEKVEQFLIKPVNPTQIFMACKQVLEKMKIQEESAASGYLKEFQQIESKLQSRLNLNEWWELYHRLVNWQLEFDEHKDIGLSNILSEQIQTCDREFVNFIETHYEKWVHSEDRPPMSLDVFPKFVKPILEENNKAILIVVDGMRHDHLMSILPFIKPHYDINLDFFISILPSATPFSRNSIFSGLFPDELVKKYPEQKQAMVDHAPSLNQYENIFLSDQVQRYGFKNIQTHYHKIWKVDEGNKFANRISELDSIDFLALVINFVDTLAHKRSESEVLMEMVPDESGYRYAVKTWFENSWLFKVLKHYSASGYTVILTSDHGSVRVNRGVMVGADRESSTGIRYKYGRNLNSNDKNAIILKNPEKFRLPILGPQSSYIMAKDDIYFLYPTQLRRYKNLYKNSFQHGGISMEELLVPVAILKSF